jgi:hypothetical protein
MNDALKKQYEGIANELKDRILELIPKRPEIMNIDDPFALLKIDGFNCDDLNPSLFQVGWALQSAKAKYRDDNPHPPKG